MGSLMKSWRGVAGAVVGVVALGALGCGLTACTDSGGGLLSGVASGGETVVARGADILLAPARCDAARAARAEAIAGVAVDRYPDAAPDIEAALAVLESGLAADSSALTLAGQLQLIDAIAAVTVSPAVQRAEVWRNKSPVAKITALLPFLMETAEGAAPILAATEAANAQCTAQP